MSEPTNVTTNPQTPTTSTAPAAAPPQGESARNSAIFSIIALCSLALIGCFFLPWITLFLGVAASGYSLQQLPSNEVKLVWLIPLAALITLVSALAKKGVLNAAQLAGAMPLLALIYYCIRLGTNLLQSLQIGAYLSLALGAILFIAPRFLEKPKS